MSVYAKVDKWNRHHPVGTKVKVRLDDGREIVSETTSLAWVLSGTAVVKISSPEVLGGYLLSRVTPLPGPATIIENFIREMNAAGHSVYLVAVSKGAGAKIKATAGEGATENGVLYGDPLVIWPTEGTTSTIFTEAALGFAARTLARVTED